MSNDAKILDRVQSQTPVAPIAGVGIANKEMGPIPSVVPEIRASGPEAKHSIDQELTGLGVKEVQDRPDLTFVPREIEHSGPNVEVPPGPTGLVQIPEKKDINSSGTWLNALREKIQKVMRLMGV